MSNLSPSIIFRLHQTNLHHLHQTVTYLIKLICICIYTYRILSLSLIFNHAPISFVKQAFSLIMGLRFRRNLTMWGAPASQTVKVLRPPPFRFEQRPSSQPEGQGGSNPSHENDLTISDRYGETPISKYFLLRAPRSLWWIHQSHLKTSISRFSTMESSSWYLGSAMWCHMSMAGQPLHGEFTSTWPKEGGTCVCIRNMCAHIYIYICNIYIYICNW